MNNIPLLQKALGKDWGQLPSVIKRHYSISNDSTSCVKGSMEIGYPSYLYPLIQLIHLCGGLISKRGQKITTVVKKSVSQEGKKLLWQRSMKYFNHSEERFSSYMVYQCDHELIEYVRYGFGLRLKVSVENGSLVYRSKGHIWQIGQFQITFPDWFVLGSATIIETPISERQFILDFKINHPLLGKTYWYFGEFSYC